MPSMAPALLEEARPPDARRGAKSQHKFKLVLATTTRSQSVQRSKKWLAKSVHRSQQPDTTLSMIPRRLCPGLIAWMSTLADA